MFNRRVNNKIICTLVIFISAATYRIFFINLIEFKIDQALSHYQTVEFFIHPEIIKVGLVASTGMYNFPLLNYLLILISIFSQNPMFMSFMIALINTLVVTFFYLIVKKFYGNNIAIISALTLSFSPWAILFSRQIWAQDLILLIEMPFFYFLHQFLINNKAKALIGVSLFLTLLSQLHGSGIILTLITLAILLFYKIYKKKQVTIKYLLFGFELGLIPAIPYFVYELTSDPFCRDCAAIMAYEKSTRLFDLVNLIRPFQLMSGLSFEFEIGKSYSEFLDTFPLVNYSHWIFLIYYALPVIAIFYILRYNKKLLYLVIYFIAIPLFYLISRTPSYIHYYVILMPIAALLTAIAYKAIYIFIKNIQARSIIISLIFISLITPNILYVGSFYKFLSVKQFVSGEYGPIYPYTQKFVDDQIKEYSSAPNYIEIESFALIYPNSLIIHDKLGEYFISQRQLQPSINQFIKALEVNPLDKSAMVNLAYSYYLNNQVNKSNEIINDLSRYDSTTAAKIRGIIKDATNSSKPH